MAKKYGPELGPVYYGKAFEWERAVGSRVESNTSHDDDLHSQVEGARVRTAVSTGLLGALGGSGYSSDSLLTAIATASSEPKETDETLLPVSMHMHTTQDISDALENSSSIPLTVTKKQL